MFEIEIQNMNLEQIADSGQCFRWKRIETEDENASKYAIVAFGRYLEIEQRGQLFSLSCDEKEWNEVWKSYFDLDTDYEDIKRRIAE